MKQKAVRIGFVFLSALLILVSFQNCGPAKISSDGVQTLSSASPYTITPVASATPEPTVSPTPSVTPSPTPSVSALKTNQGYCLERSLQLDSYGAPKLIQAPCSNNQSQVFAKAIVSNDVFQLSSGVSGECINVPAGLTNEGTRIDFWECYANYAGHQWRFMDVGSGMFKLIDSNSQKCLTYNTYSIYTDQQVYISTCQDANPFQTFHY